MFPAEFRKLSRKAIGIGAMVATVLLCLAASTLFPRSTVSQTPRPIPVRVSVAQAVASASDLRYSANIVPGKQVDLAFKVGGYVRDIAEAVGPDGQARDVRPGDRVKAGMVLARIDTKDYVVQADQIQASLEEAKASLTMAQKDFDRHESLVKRGYVAKGTFDKKQEIRDVAAARLEAVKAQLNLVNNQLADTVLKSPMDGVVANRFIERGTLVGLGTRAFGLVDLNTVKAVFGVPDSLLPQIKKGERLSVVVDALNQREFTGTITAVSPSADTRSRVFDVEVTLQNQNMILKDGMIATVSISDSISTNTRVPARSAAPSASVSVPLQSVVRPPDDPNGYRVFVTVEKTGKFIAQARRVELGDVTGRSVIVRHGVAPDERVITAGATIVYEGAPLSIVP
jgi:RND family efflux transporter MFP subunit